MPFIYATQPPSLLAMGGGTHVFTTTSTTYVLVLSATTTSTAITWPQLVGYDPMGTLTQVMRELDAHALITHRSNPAIIKARWRAKAKARRLLESFLDDQQKLDFEQRGWFIVEGRRGIRYRVCYAKIGNIEVLKPDGEISQRLCVHPMDPSLPIEDVMAAQLLQLRSNEVALLRIANRHSPGWERPVPRWVH